MKKTVVISGAGPKNLGRTIAQQLSDEYRVVILARTKDKLKETAKEIGCDFEVCDISDANSVESVVKNIIDKTGRIDCLINCAALWVEGELSKNTPKEIAKSVNVGVTGTLFLTRTVIFHMKQQKSGSIININSQGGLYAFKERSVYNATKWAMTGFTKSLQQELAPYGISVVGIYPGRLAVTMTTKEGKKECADAVPLENIAKTIRFLLSFEDGTTFLEIGIKHLKGY